MTTLAPKQMTVEEMVSYIGSIAMLRVEQWRDKYRAWRVGVEWYGENECLYVCERSTLETALRYLIEHKDEWEPYLQAYRAWRESNASSRKT